MRVVGDGVTVLCEGALCGAPPDAPGDGLAGTGIVVLGRGVTLRGARVAGFRVGIRAEGADGLALEACDVSGNYRQRLRSTPEREDEADWLWPHANDAREWERYGAGIWIERASGVRVVGCRARRGQNGLVLDQVERSAVVGNDFSFLSGWGIALWRTCDVLVARNACDFCVRGYSHGVYNRGQDSAGLLLFEQCSRNRIEENSATHCGDGLFAFGGREALGEVAGPPGFSSLRAGDDDNAIVANDLSYAAAHGLELTFSFGNRVEQNRLVGNAICGLWGGYSRDTLVAENEIAANGERGYARERGGVNIEHGQRNRVERNRFRDNACGVHLWWDEDAALAALPWARANGHASQDNAILANAFEGDRLAIELRAAGRTWIAGNAFAGVGAELAADEASPLERAPPLAHAALADVAARAGERAAPPCAAWPELASVPSPLGARARLAGREHIVLTEWGPYDWEAPLLWRAAGDAATHRYRMLGAAIEAAQVSAGRLEQGGDTLTVTADVAGALAYELRVTAAGAVHAARGTLAPAADAR